MALICVKNRLLRVICSWCDVALIFVLNTVCCAFELGIKVIMGLCCARNYFLSRLDTTLN